MQTSSNSQAGPRKRLEHLSKNGRWRAFPKVPHLLQHVTSDDYSGKTKIHRETIRKSLRTTIWSTVQLRLVDFLKAHRESRERVPSPKFSEVVDRFTREIAADSALKPKRKEYRLLCLKRSEPPGQSFGSCARARFRHRLARIGLPGSKGGFRVTTGDFQQRHFSHFQVSLGKY